MARKSEGKHSKLILWILLSATLLYFAYWFSMLLFTKTLDLNNSLFVRVPILWDLVRYTGDYDYGKKFDGGFYSGEALGKKASFTVNRYSFDINHYILTQDLAGLTFSKTIVAGKDALLFEPVSDSYGNWKIYVINMDGKTLGVEVNYLKEKSNVFERYILNKVEENIIKSITFKK